MALVLIYADVVKNYWINVLQLMEVTNYLFRTYTPEDWQSNMWGLITATVRACQSCRYFA